MVVEVAHKLCAEFVGTFVLCFTAGSAALSLSPLAPLSIAASLAVSIYAMGSVSGANFNPAVSFGLLLAGKSGHGDMDVATFGQYTFAQLVAGCGAMFAASMLYGEEGATVSQSQPWSADHSLLSHNLFAHKDAGTYNFKLGGGHYLMTGVNQTTGGPDVLPGDYSAIDVFFVEFLYTAMLVFTVLNVATCGDEGAGQKNYYFGLCIGFVIVAGAVAGGSISGACFNPAVSFGIAISSVYYSSVAFGDAILQWFLYLVAELAGASFAFGLFRVCRAHLFLPADVVPMMTHAPSLPSKLLCEFVGTFFLCFTVTMTCSAVTPSVVGIVGIASSLSIMIYSVGPVSGGHLNPAVSFGLALIGAKDPSEKSKEMWTRTAAYIVTQLVAGFIAVLSAWLIHGPVWHVALAGTKTDTDNLTLMAQGTAAGIFGAEFFYTFLLVFVVLNVAVSDAPNQYFGLAIGLVVVVGGIAVGGISGGCFNPAVAFAFDFGALLGATGSDPRMKKFQSTWYGESWIYLLIQLTAAGAAALVLKVVREMHEDDEHHDEDSDDYEEDEEAQ